MAKDRRILPAELAHLKALAAPFEASTEKLQDIQLMFNKEKALNDELGTKFNRQGAFLVKKYRVKADEQIDSTTGLIDKIPPKEPASAEEKK